MKTRTYVVFRVTILTLALLSLLSHRLSISAAGHYISARVICKIGVGVANARVQLIRKGPNIANSPDYDSQTDRSGRVSFKNFRSGTYDLVVTCGAATFSREIYTGAGLASFSHDYVFRCCPTPPGAPPGPNPDDGLIAIDNKTVTDDVTAHSRVVPAYTRDWQPGNDVSFSFSGNVYGSSGEKQTQDDYTGDIVGIVDSQGNKTEVPWSKLITYKVPEGATFVTASLMKPDRSTITTAHIPVNPKGTPAPIELPPTITGNCVAYPVSQIGKPYTVYAPKGRFSGDANKIKLLATNKADNATTESNAVAASPHSALFHPQDKEPGSYKYEVIDEGRFADSFDVITIGIKLDTSRAYRVNQEGTLAIVVALPPYVDAQEKLFSQNFQVTIEMETPRVLTFSNGQNEVVWSLHKSEAANNQARKEFSVRAGAPGSFKITARANAPRCNNPTVTTAKAREPVVLSGPNVLFKDQGEKFKEDLCAKLRKRLDDLNWNIDAYQEVLDDAERLIRARADADALAGEVGKLQLKRNMLAGKVKDGEATADELEKAKKAEDAKRDEWKAKEKEVKEVEKYLPDPAKTKKISEDQLKDLKRQKDELEKQLKDCQ